MSVHPRAAGHLARLLRAERALPLNEKFQEACGKSRRFGEGPLGVARILALPLEKLRHQLFRARLHQALIVGAGPGSLNDLVNKVFSRRILKTRERVERRTPAAVAGFLLQHAIQGWCPPVPVLRRLGFRTQREIDDERAVLKARRGDFEQVRDMPSRRAIESG